MINGEIPTRTLIVDDVHFCLQNVKLTEKVD